MGRPFSYGLPPSLNPALREALRYWEKCPTLWQVPAELLEASSPTSPVDPKGAEVNTTEPSLALDVIPVDNPFLVRREHIDTLDPMNNELTNTDKPEEVTEQTIYDQLFAMREAGMSEDDLLVRVSEIILQQRQEIERAREEIPHAAAQEQIKQVQDAHERGVLKGREDLMKNFRQGVYSRLPGGQQILDRMGYFVNPAEGVEKLHAVLRDRIDNEILSLTPSDQKGAVRRRLENVPSTRAKIAAYCNHLATQQLEAVRQFLKEKFAAHRLSLELASDLTPLIRTGLQIAEGVGNDKAQDRAMRTARSVAYPYCRDTPVDLPEGVSVGEVISKVYRAGHHNGREVASAQVAKPTKFFESLRENVRSYAHGTPIKVPDVDDVCVMADAIYRAGKHDGEEQFKVDKLRPVDLTWKKVVKSLLTTALETSQAQSREIYDAVDRIAVEAAGATYTAVKGLVRKIVSEKGGARTKEFMLLQKQRDALAKAIAQVADGGSFYVDSFRSESEDRLRGKVYFQGMDPFVAGPHRTGWEFDRVDFSAEGLPEVHVVQRR